MGAKKIPRAWRALKGWRKLTPGRSRSAHPLAVWAAMACRMAARGRMRMAVFVLVALSSYARPSALFRCRKFSLVRPVKQITSTWCLLLDAEELGVPSKAKEYDSSRAPDSPFLLRMAPDVLEVLKQEMQTGRLSDFDHGDLVEEISAVNDKLGTEMPACESFHGGLP